VWVTKEGVRFVHELDHDRATSIMTVRPRDAKRFALHREAVLWVKQGKEPKSRRILQRERLLAFGPMTRVSVGLAIIGVIAGFTLIPAGASTIKSNESYARAQLLKLSDLPGGYTKSGDTSVGTSEDNNSASMFTMTQFPDIATCLGDPPALSIVAAEASTPDFLSKDGNTDVFDVADVYTSVNDAKSDFPPLTNPKFAKCFAQVQGSVIVSTDQSNWPSGSTFGTPSVSVSHQPKYGDQSGLVEVQVPVTLPEGEGTSNDFFVAFVIREGRSVAELIIDQGDTTPSAALMRSLAQKVTTRMKAKPPGNSIVAA
jgi:hypothetical protein